ncbi:hypothetical protein LB579_31685 [Mesorhizobium sp. BR1-1-7]|uniref:hypothetical protein n=1 Tax=Mesorhizobium sp. BR1-1-7 TaxID=2876647 RepID=UPI001CCFF39C|nr:hypothetical protein [Mesorhizobium sp. BR1-1-7]MBZ9922241.1 hypothetical protein [Mesorhizobium sp. BR1-1-7]
MSKHRGFAYAALGMVFGLSIAFLFLIWAVPGFRNPAATETGKQYITYLQSGDDNPVKASGFWETYTTPSDTYAQWIAAISAAIGLGVSIAAVALVWHTLELNRAATDAAVKATQAAMRANEISEQTSVAQLRPYVVVDGIDCQYEAVASRIGMDVRVHVHWMNCGQTPTRGMRWDLNYKRTIARRGLPVGFDFPPADIGRAVLGPGQTTRDVSTLIKFRDYEAVLKGVAQIHLWGWVEYSDSFPGSARHRSEICVTLIPCTGDEIFQPHTHAEHNGADADCLKKPMTTA